LKVGIVVGTFDGRDILITLLLPDFETATNKHIRACGGAVG
jgi:hypothetical protein